MLIRVGNVKCTAFISGEDNVGGIDLRGELVNYLRERPLNYFHSPLYKARRWDGWKYLFTRQGEFATGFLPLVVNFARDLGAEVTIQDHRGPIAYLRDELDPDVGHYDLMPHQLDAVKKLRGTVAGIPFPRGIYGSATNSGKTAIAAGIAKNLIHPSKASPQTLVLIHSDNIFRQHIAYFMGCRMRVTAVKGARKDFSGQLVVAMAPTLASAIKRGDRDTIAALSRVDAVMVDEGHRAAGEAYKLVLQHITGAGVRIILSGTATEHKDKYRNLVIVGHSGTAKVNITNQEMIAAGVSRRPVITMLLHPKAGPSYRRTRDEVLMSYEEERERWHVTDADRIEKYADDYEKNDERTLITVERVEHGERVKAYYEKRFPDHTVVFAHGNSEYLNTVFDDFSAGHIDVLIATMIVQEGLNMEGVECLQMMQGGMSAIRTKQLVGRVLRTKGAKDNKVRVLDMYDPGDYLSEHSRARIRIYKKEGFEIQYTYPNKNGKPTKVA